MTPVEEARSPLLCVKIELKTVCPLADAEQLMPIS